MSQAGWGLSIRFKILLVLSINECLKPGDFPEKQLFMRGNQKIGLGREYERIVRPRHLDQAIPRERSGHEHCPCQQSELLGPWLPAEAYAWLKSHIDGTVD